MEKNIYGTLRNQINTRLNNFICSAFICPHAVLRVDLMITRGIKLNKKTVFCRNYLISYVKLKIFIFQLLFSFRDSPAQILLYPAQEKKDREKD